jgi:hypothetical protein
MFLLGFAVLGVPPTAGAELLEGQAVRIVPLVLLSVVVALLALVASERQEHTISSLGHNCAEFYGFLSA